MEKLCSCYNGDTGYCSNTKRLMADMNYTFGKKAATPIPCDYDKAQDKMNVCPFNK